MKVGVYNRKNAERKCSAFCFGIKIEKRDKKSLTFQGKQGIMMEVKYLAGISKRS
jgi:hypothetical protein